MEWPLPGGVAVTGASGFIGRRLVAEHLRRGDRVRILTRKAGAALPEGVEAHVGDLAGELPAGFPGEADVLYHCAAELRDVANMESINVGGTARLLAAAGGIGRWVQLSSVGVYGPQRVGVVTEETSPAPANPYERSKAEADRLVMAGAAAGGFGYAILRPSIVFGTDMPNPSLRQLAAMVRRGLFFFIGPPGATANYIHVDDVVAALMLCGSHPRAAGQVFNLSDCRSFEDFIAAIAAACGVPRPTRRLPENLVRALAAVFGRVPRNPLTTARIEAMTGRASYPIDKIRGMLGYVQSVPMEEGIVATLGGFNAAGGRFTASGS